jgi:Uma2 family endonuclease
VSSSDLKVRFESTNLTTFPFVTVVCGERRTAAIDPNAVINPTLLVEVTSSSTEDYDRGKKLSNYQQIPSLLVVLIVSHRHRCVTIAERSRAGWVQRDALAGESIVIEALGLSLSVDELYAGIQLELAPV